MCYNLPHLAQVRLKPWGKWYEHAGDEVLAASKSWSENDDRKESCFGIGRL